MHDHKIPWRQCAEKVVRQLYYPSKDSQGGRVFRVFKRTRLEDVKVVILGQDPYPAKDMATGVAFEIPDNARMTPSLKIIYDEIENTYGPTERKHNLQHLASQGVLLLNSSLTVAPGVPGSHTRHWRPFIRAFLLALTTEKPIVVSPWGNVAQSVCGQPPPSPKGYISTLRGSMRIDAPHPMKDHYSRAEFFRSSNIFEKINEALAFQGQSPITWKYVKNSTKRKTERVIL